MTFILFILYWLSAEALSVDSEFQSLADNAIRPWVSAHSGHKLFSEHDVEELVVGNAINGIRVTICKGKIIVNKNGSLNPGLHTRRDCALDILHHVDFSNITQNIDFFLNFSDGPLIQLKPMTYRDMLPMFAYSSRVGFADLAFTTYCTYRELHVYKHAFYPWHDRKDSFAVWRGGTTGGIYTVENWKSFRRSKLVLMSKDNPEYLDAKFISCNECSPDAWEAIVSEVGHGEMIDVKTFKYVIDVDGNGWSSRFINHLAEGILIFKQESEYNEFFIGLLTPWIHYVPIKSDLSDLIEHIQYAKAHDDEMREIAENAKSFANNFLFDNRFQLYTYYLLRNYASLFEDNYTPKVCMDSE